MPPKQTLWSETCVYVTKSLRLNKVLAHKVPSRITFTADDNKIFFLAGSGRSCLYSVNLEQECEDIEKPMEQTQFFDNPHVPISREEELLRERQRISKSGITSFEYSDDTLLVPLGNNLYYHDMNHPENKPNVIKEAEDNLQYFDTKLCPTDARLISFIRDNDLYVTSSHVREYVRLTTSPKPDAIYNGVPSFVVQEEFDRYTGYYWRPKQEGDVYHVLYEQVDETVVPDVRLLSSACVDHVYKFPLAGQPNATTQLRVAKLTLNTQDPPIVKHLRLPKEIHEIFPWVEYMPWFGWHPSGDSVWVMLLNRAQQKYFLISIPLSSFVEQTTDNHVDNVTKEEKEEVEKEEEVCGVTVLLSKTSNTWVDVSDDLRFLPSSRDFVYLYESDYPHLYLVSPESSQEVALTHGDWSVTSLVAVSATEAYFHAQVNPIQQHLYKVSLDAPGEITQLTPDGFYHCCTINNGLTQFASVYSNAETHYQCGLFCLKTGNKLRTITPTMNFGEVYLKKAALGPGESSLDAITTYRYDTPIIDKIKLNDRDVYYMVYPAKGVDLTVPQPVLLYVYGGPAIQLVVDRFKGVHHRQQNLFATLGYTVVIADCPGSANRGKVWSEALYKKMGSVEVNMQIQVLEELAKQYTYMDLSRVAVIGTSYGGYVSLMALAQRPDFFKVGVAVAPAVAWYLYDTAYSERYMGLLPENEEIYYGASCVLDYVNNLPNEEHRLLIIHGLMDENVHFTHTTTLISELISAGKPYDLQVYPEERHGIGRGNAPAHCDTTIAVYLRNHLKFRA